MPRQAAAKDLSLKSLELFQICARQGSLQAAARECSRSVIELVGGKMRSLIRDHALLPLHKANRWLGDSFKLLNCL